MSNAGYYRRKIEELHEDNRDNPFMKLWDLLGDVDTGEYNEAELKWMGDLEKLQWELIEILLDRKCDEWGLVGEVRKIHKDTYLKIPNC
tara:strand:- start:2030 stop:2296 length:267 start_codon:yes stop_codon:yes gene_type:complete